MALVFQGGRGKHVGKTLTPHCYDDGFFVVSKSRFETEYTRVKHERELPAWVAKGYGVRMSCAGRSPSLIGPRSIKEI
jgi:hypothetical protein